MPNEELLKQMHDIELLDSIHWWPLAIGWWLLICIVIGTIIFAAIFYIRNRKYKQSWMYLIYRNLNDLEKSIETKSKKQIVTELSEYLRQIAIKKYPRGSCAGISGKEWLIWLKEHDPKSFDWVQYGGALILGPYVQESYNMEVDLKLLINAAKKWVK